MRREGFEFCIGRPEVIIREENGIKMEPFEHLVIDTPVSNVAPQLTQVTLHLW
jgi:predicted membrane GTPase involved in stress response